MRDLENSGVDKKRTHPILWVPTSYFGMGTIYMTVTLVTTIMYRNLGMSDEIAAFWGSALAFPYVVKFLWGGDINGVYGMIGFLVGGLLGGVFVAKNGLSTKILFFLCCMMNIPNATYIYLGVTQPESISFIGFVVTAEKFGFGFGAVGHMMYMMQQLAPGKYKTEHYSIGTALMGFCMMSTGMVSGYIKTWLGRRATCPIFGS